MRTKDAFSGCHPLVNFLYFALVIGLSMFFGHPACVAVSLVCATVYAAKLGGESVKKLLRFLLPSSLFIAAVNPLFNHRGITVLCRLPGGNNLTLESILYGLSSAAAFCAALLWFSAFTEVITGDKFVYLFGKIIPALSLVLSVTLRFVPRFSERLKTTAEARAAIGKSGEGAGIKARVKSAFAAFSATVTFALENAGDTADSMRARGWGLKGRTAFSVFRFYRRDRSLLVWLSVCAVFILCANAAGALSWRWFPFAAGAGKTALTVCAALAYSALCLTPVAVDIKDELKWKYIRSKI